MKDDGLEGHVGPEAEAGFLHYEGPGHLNYGGAVALGTEIRASYAEGREGAVSYQAPGCPGLLRRVMAQMRTFGDGMAGREWWVEVQPPPPDSLILSPSRSVVSVSGPVWGAAPAVAVWADGTTADPDPDTDITFSVDSEWIDLKQADGSGAQSVRLPYSDSRAWRGARWDGAVYFIPSDKRDEAPLCDTPVEITARAWGVSGTTAVTVRGSSTATAPDSLLVSVVPQTVGPGERADLQGTVVTRDECVASGIAPSEPMRVLLSDGAHGSLEHAGEVGTALTVPYEALQTGAVSFVASDSLAGLCGTVWVGVAGVGVEGAAAISVEVPPVTEGVIAPPRPEFGDMRGLLEDEPSCEVATCPIGPPDVARLDRAHALIDALTDWPAGLLHVPCDQVPAWAEVGSHTVPPAVLAQFDADPERTTYYVGGGTVVCGTTNRWDVHELTEAAGSQLNLDYYPVHIQLPPGMTSEALFDHIQQNFGDFIDPEQALFELYDYEHATRWEDGQVVGTVGEFSVALPGLPPGAAPGAIDELGVLGTALERGPERSYWRFTTVMTPSAGAHPVSGTREFGIVVNPDGTYTFYTRGVDRLTDSAQRFAAFITELASGTPEQFAAADQLWRGLQERVSSFVRNAGGQAASLSPEWHRVDWEAYAAYFEGDIPLGELLRRIGCAP